MKIGYARVSTLEQNLDLQLQAPEKAGCKKIFREKVSASNRERPVETVVIGGQNITDNNNSIAPQPPFPCF